MAATFGPAQPGRLYLKQRLPDGNWYITRKPERSLGTKDLREAERRYDLEMGKVPAKRGDIRNKEAFAYWARTHRVKPSSMKNYVAVWNQYAAPVLDGLLVSEVTVDHIIRILNKAEQQLLATTGKGKAESSRYKQVYVCLSGYFKAQTQMPTRYRDDNPVSQLGAYRPEPSVSGAVGVEEVLRLDQVDLLVRACAETLPLRARFKDKLLAKQLALLVQVLAFGGMRIGEALALHITDLEEDGLNGEWRVERQVNRDRDKDNPLSWFITLKGKDGTIGDRLRYVPVTTPELRAALDAYIAEGIEEQWLKPGGLLFPTETGKPRLVTGVDARFAKVRDAAGLSLAAGRRKDTVIHHLRHTFASWMLESDTVSIEDISALIGDTIEVCTERYAHLSNRTQRNARVGQAMARRHGKLAPAPVAAPVAAESNVIHVAFGRQVA